MKQHELEIKIEKDGKVRVEVKGAKGKGCLAYAKLLEKLIGRMESQDFTSEYYEPDETVRIDPKIQGKVGRKD